MYKPGEHTYLAAPFFNSQQRELCDFIEELFLRSDIPLYSPRNDGFVLKPDATNEERNQIFQSNVMAIRTARWVLAVIDDFDPGVIWEMGLAYGHSVPTLAYSDVPGRGLNVMLAGSCKLGFVNGRPNLTQLIESAPVEGPAFPMNTWSGEVQ